MARLGRSTVFWARLCVTMAVAAAPVALACGSGDNDSAGTNSSTTVAAPPSPDQAFLDRVEDEAELSSSDDPQQVLDVAHTLCDDIEKGLADLAEAQELDASPDASTLVSLAETYIKSSLLRAAREFTGDSVTQRAVMSAAADHLCQDRPGTRSTAMS